MGLGRGPACLGPGSDALVYDPGRGSVVACCDIILVSKGKPRRVTYEVDLAYNNLATIHSR